MVLEVLNGQGLDEESVDDGGDEGFRPGDCIGRDRLIDQVVLGQVTQVQGHSLGISFHFCGKEEVIIPTQQDGDMAGVGRG